MNPTCHCQSSKPYSQCCEPFITKKAFPKTPEELMRSRYSAYVVQNIDYIAETNDPKGKNDDFDRKSAETWAKESEWLGLEIVAASGTEVEFQAKYKLEGIIHTHHETSTFRFDDKDKRWYFVEGNTHNTPILRAGPKVGRNDPCYCGSGKKLKKCCG